MQNSELYENRKNRDDRAKYLKTLGYNVKKSSTRGQQLHPMYVKDYPYPLSDADKCFGNTIYKTLFSVLYEVSW